MRRTAQEDAGARLDTPTCSTACARRAPPPFHSGTLVLIPDVSPGQGRGASAAELSKQSHRPVGGAAPNPLEMGLDPRVDRTVGITREYTSASTCCPRALPR